MSYEPLLSYENRQTLDGGPIPTLLTRPITNTYKRITPEQIKLFTDNPTTLPNKQFLLDEDDGSDTLYEVTEVRFLKGHWEYLVRFEGCYDTVDMPGEMMEDFLKKSSLVEGK